MKGLDVASKSERVYSFHKKTIYTFVEMMAAAGIDDPSKFKRSHIFQRSSAGVVKRYDQLFPNMPVGCCLHTDEIPDVFKKEMLMMLEED